mgnify:FL=1
MPRCAISAAFFCFNPRPSQPEGATTFIDADQKLNEFQSTPLPTGRSDPGASGPLSAQLGFNPRPSQPEGATKI